MTEKYIRLDDVWSDLIEEEFADLVVNDADTLLAEVTKNEKV